MARISSDYTFRGVEYVVSTEATKGEDSETELLVVEVEDKTSAEQWRGEFEPRYIEELTHKTGNFKQFSVFCNMLQSAATQSSASVSLDLLTYEDLERLRSRQKGGGQGSKRGGGGGGGGGRQLGNKKYLILTYSVEFDRIHYPLPLPYQGKPDPVAQQATIRKLKNELEQLRRQLTKGHKRSDVIQLQTAYEDLLKEKEDLEEAFERFRHDVKLSQAGNASKEIQVLKKVIRTLEADLLKERTKHQRSSRRQSDQNRGLLLELEDLRTSERNLRIRVKSLTNELATLKKGQRIGSLPRHKPPSYSRQRSSSGERRPRPRSRSRDEDRQEERRKPFTPSPAGARYPRFDPTAYVRDKQRKLRDANPRRAPQGKQMPRVPRSRSNSSERRPIGNQLPLSSPTVIPAGHHRRQRSRGSSAGSMGSRRSSRDSSLERSDSSIRIETSNRSRPRWRGRYAWQSPGFSRKPARQASTPKHTKHTSSRQQDLSREEEYAKRSAEISEIDARLNALKQFMKSSMET
ncbi:centrosomal protein CCDC61-like [Oscarella lobularis]|uniref:centrosomal protein CCDC61-like n=1 Tax=Oscarella lobularis TaxID=121494 RepID=UPI0033142EE7